MNPTIHQINPEFAAAGQISVEDVPDIRDAGFKSVIINIPDYESGDAQPSSGAIIDACREAGLEAVYQPVPLGHLNVEQVEAFAALLQALSAPVLAYCKSGGRSSVLYRAACHLNEEERYV